MTHETTAPAPGGETMTPNTREALERIKALVTGERAPNWDHGTRTTLTRCRIADICDAALSSSPSSTTATPPLSEQEAVQMVADYERAVRKLDRMPLGNAEADQAEKVTAMRKNLLDRLSALPSSRALSAEDAQFLADRIEAWARSWPARDDDVTRDV
jgi:hypothetical protein